MSNSVFSIASPLSAPKRRVLGASSGAPPVVATLKITPSRSNEEQTHHEQEVLACPICNESMVSLSQLNQHIDDLHSSPNELSSSLMSSGPISEATKWLRNNFESPPLPDPHSPVPHKRKNVQIDLLDRNKGFSLSESPSKSTSTPSPTASPTRRSFNAQSRLSRTHWKQPSSVNQDICSMNKCKKALNIKNGKVNCRRCGLLFCDEHTLYRSRLKNTIQPLVPVDFDASQDGAWARVCKRCMNEKFSEINEIDVPMKCDLTDIFKRKRQQTVDERDIQVNIKHKRFIMFVNLHAERYFKQKDKVSWLSWMGNDLEKEEIKIVGVENWKPDDQSLQCALCFSPFNFLTRRHHCRLCGRVVCDGTLSQTPVECSMNVPISLLLSKGLSDLNYSPFVKQRMDELTQIKGNNLNLSSNFHLRCCRECKNDLLYKLKSRNSSPDALSEAIFKIYQQLLTIKAGIAGVYPRYAHAVKEYKPGNMEPINKLRTRLMSYLRDYETSIALFKRTFFSINEDNMLRPVPILGKDYQKVANNIYQSSTAYLQETLINLKQLSSLLKEMENKSLMQLASSAGAAGTSAGSNIADSTMSSETSGPIQEDLTKRQIRELREQLMVMNEQKFIIENLIDQASKKRKYDEIQPLQDNKHELENSIAELESRLGEFGF